MLANIHLNNFKCFEDQDIPCAPLTFLSGKNGMGKSSVIQALLLLRQSHLRGFLEKGIVDLKGDLVDLGAGKDILYEGANSESIDIGIQMTEGEDFCFHLSYNQDSNALPCEKNIKNPPLEHYALFNNQFVYLEAERLGPRKWSKTSDYDVRQLRQIGSKGEFAVHFLSIFGDEPIAKDIFVHPESNNRTLKSQVECWLSELSPGVRLDVVSILSPDLVGLRYAFQSGTHVSNPYSAPNSGFGLSYILPVLIALLSSQKNQLIILENPEAHLHPMGQAKMGELIARVAAVDRQIILETHSDHILNGIRCMVHEKILDPQKTKLHFFNRKEDQMFPKSFLETPIMDANARLDIWPDGFFDVWEKYLEKIL